MSIYKQIGKKLKYLREQRNLTAQDVADKLGYKNDVSVFHIENGHRKISLEHLLKVVDLYNVSVLELLGIEENAKMNIITALRNDEDLTEEDIDRVLSYIMFIKSHHDTWRKNKKTKN